MTPAGSYLRMHQHLRRLSRTWIDNPLYFITSCTNNRKRLLACEMAADILRVEWQNARLQHGWAIGRYVFMPDHVHFFCAPYRDAKPLSMFMAKWKEWTSKRLNSELRLTNSLWQKEFFDHLLRSRESYGAKWHYVRENPVRAGLVAKVEEWPWQGEIELLRFD